MILSSSPWFSIVSCKTPQLLLQPVPDLLAAIPDRLAMPDFPRTPLRIPAWNPLDIRDTKTRAASGAVQDNKWQSECLVPAGSRAGHRAVYCELRIGCRRVHNLTALWGA